MNGRAKAILNYWFEQISHKERFTKNNTLDHKIRDVFFEDYQKAINNNYDNWQNNANECLALIILLDQFSRNLFRNDGKAFFMDTKARLVANEAINRKYHKKLKQDQVMFIFLPFMHSEKLSDQIFCCNLIDTFFEGNSNYEQAKKYAQLHKNIIEKFSRFPYRNQVLGRKSTKEEEEYLNSTHYDFFNI